MVIRGTEQKRLLDQGSAREIIVFCGTKLAPRDNYWPTPKDLTQEQDAALGTWDRTPNPSSF